METLLSESTVSPSESSSKRGHDSRDLPWRWILLAFLLAGSLAGVRLFLTYRHRGVSIALEEALTTGWMDWLIWAALSPALFRLANRFPLERRRAAGRILLHLVASAAFAATHVAAFAAGSSGVRALRFGQGQFEAEVRSGFQWNFPGNLVTYWAIVLAYQVWFHRRQWQHAELRRAQLAQDLAESRLRQLQHQLRPHFLFNTLNSIAGLISSRPRDADAMIVRLSRLLRRSLEFDPHEQVRLQEELDFVEQYLALQKTRYGNRLETYIEVTPQVRECLLPAMLLQPLVENAIQHAIEPVPGPGWIRIRAHCKQGDLILDVEDSGPGLPSSPDTGFGLGSTRERLAHHYGSRYPLEFHRDEAGRHRIRLRIPQASPQHFEAGRNA